MKIIIWGVGPRTEYYLSQGLYDDCEIIAFVDSKEYGKSYYSKEVYNPRQLFEMQKETDYIVISNRFYDEILVQLESIGVDMDRVVITDGLTYKPYKQYFLRLMEACPLLYKEVAKNAFIVTRENERDSIDSDSIYFGRTISNAEYANDYFRYRSFEFIAEELLRNNVVGDVAEFGVFRGLFSALINRKFPDKKLFLFDTFEGFDTAEAEQELGQGRCNEDFIQAHKETSVAEMLKNLSHPEKAVICKGFFPKSITEEAINTTFSFVSIDVDFEESTLEGLRFFYPRLAENGYIMLHDYNTYYLEGVKLAVERYEAEENIVLKKVPLADRAGTLVIVK